MGVDASQRAAAPARRLRERLAGLSLKTRIGMAVALPLLALLAGGLLSLVQLQRANERMGSLYRDRVIPLRQLKQVADAFAVDLVDQTHKVRDGSVSWADARRTLAQARGSATLAWRDYLATYLIDDERALIETVEPRLHRAQELARDLDDILARQDGAALQRFAAQRMYPVVDPLSQSLNALSHVQLDESERMFARNEAAYREAALAMGAALLAVLAGAATLAWMLSSGTVRSIRQAARAAEAVAKGDLAQAVEVRTTGSEAAVLLTAIESIRQQLQCSMDDMVQLLHIVPVPMLTATPGRDRVRHANPAFEDYFGLRHDAVVGQCLHELPIWLDDEGVQAWHRHRQALETSSAWLQRAELLVRQGNGLPARCEVATMLRRYENPSSMLLSFEDVTERRSHEQALKDRAEHDALTGLLNRSGAELAMAGAWQAWRLREEPFAVVMIDLDRFKPINDELGHAAGDAVLVEVARRLVASNRSADFCGRWGGDEFVVLLAGCADLGVACATARRMLDAIAETVLVAGAPRRIGASIGVVHCAEDVSSAADLLERADRLMYEAKGMGRNRVVPDMDVAVSSVAAPSASALASG